MKVLRLVWLLGLLGFALAPWSLKFRLGIAGRHHDFSHVIAFFLTAIVLSAISRAPRHFHYLSGPILQGFLGLLAAVATEFFEVLMYHNGFEWRDLAVDCAGLAMGFALFWQVPAEEERFLPVTSAENRH
jgi:VanZ family protein